MKQILIAVTLVVAFRRARHGRQFRQSLRHHARPLTLGPVNAQAVFPTAPYSSQA